MNVFIKGVKEGTSTFHELFIKKARFYSNIGILICGVVIMVMIGTFGYYVQSAKRSLSQEMSQKQLVQKKLSETQQELDTLKQVDQYKKNKELEETIKNIEKIYNDSIRFYEKTQDLKAQTVKTDKEDKLIAQSLSYLAKRNYSSAAATLELLDRQITQDTPQPKAVALIDSIPAPQSNTPPNGGFARQRVSSDVGDFTVDIISADLGSTRVIVDTASDSDCHHGCPTLPLSEYVSRNGAFAGINGSYFCPAEYPSCAGKTNSFDLLVMNKNKHYFNSDNNIYSNNPAVIFGSGFIRFVGAASAWGRDTSVDGALSNYPLLVSGGQVVYGGSGDSKFNGKGPRGFVANRGNTVYIGFVEGATMSDSAHVLKAMGMENAMNLDEGGSTALWYGGYKLGPGRNIPNAILFVRK